MTDTGKKKKKCSKAKAASKSSKGRLSDEAVDAMLDGQEHMLGELNQVRLLRVILSVPNHLKDCSSTRTRVEPTLHSSIVGKGCCAVSCS